MKLRHLLYLVFLAAAGIVLAEAQTTKTAPPAKKANASTEKNPSQQLPFANARDMAVMIFWADPPTTPGGRPRAKSEPSGSGVWIGKSGYVATCNHVIANWTGPFKIGIARDPYVTEGTFSVSITGSVNTFVAVLVASDPAADVAILKVENTPEGIQKLFANSPPLVTGAPMGTLITKQHPVSPRGASLKTDFPEQGETLLLAGFPLSHDAQDTLILQIGVATGLFSPPLAQHAPPASGLRIMLSLVANPGNSGGPVFDADGKVIGLLEGGLQSPIRDDHNHDLHYLRPKLDQNGQPMHDTSGQPIIESAPYLQNSGISYAVPAKFVADLAEKNHVKLD
jgi:S1-C subfamily serine protease